MIRTWGKNKENQKQALKVRERDQIVEAPVDRRDVPIPERLFLVGGRLLPMKVSGGGEWSDEPAGKASNPIVGVRLSLPPWWCTAITVTVSKKFTRLGK